MSIQNQTSLETRKLKTIKIEKIRILNPRARNQRNFGEIVKSIAQVGLKRPITVSPRTSEMDCFEYDLVCGQGDDMRSARSNNGCIRPLSEKKFPLLAGSLERHQSHGGVETQPEARWPPSESQRADEQKQLTLVFSESCRAGTSALKVQVKTQARANNYREARGGNPAAAVVLITKTDARARWGTEPLGSALS